MQAGRLFRQIVAALLLLGCMARADAAPSPTLLEVWVNDRPTGMVGEFMIRGDTLAASPEELAELGLAPRVICVDGLAQIVRDPQFSWWIDGPRSAIHVTASDSRLVAHRISATSSSIAFQRAETGMGVTLNYDFSFLSTAEGENVSGVVEARIFSRAGVFSTDAFVGYGNARSSIVRGTVRLDSTYSMSFPHNMLRLRVGDFVTAGPATVRALRMGGIQFGSDFGLRPDLITMPLPTLHASAAVPTAADILVNGSYGSTVDIGSGPFEVRNVPVVSGAGTISLNLRDAGGNAVSKTVGYYASNALLATGLQNFVIQFGALRRNFGLESDDYGPWAASASYRRGLSSHLTAEGHVELSATTKVVQAGLTANLADFAIATQSLAASTTRGQDGFRSISQIEHSDHLISARLSYTIASSGFRDLAINEGAPSTLRQIEANLGVSLGWLGNLSLAYNHFDQADAQPLGPARPYEDRPWFQRASGTALKLVSANYSIQRGQFTIYANAFASLGENRSHQFVLGMSLPFGAGTQGNASVQTLDQRWQAGLQVARGTSPSERWGYRAGLWRGAVNSQNLELAYQAPIGWISTGIDNTDGRTTGRLQVRGSVSAIDGAVYPSSIIANSFAIVDTAGMAGIKVYDENRLVGRTDRRGTLLVADLRAFELNHVAIDSTDLPADMIVASDSRTVRPQDRSGVVLRFPLVHSRAALVRLVDAANQPVPAGSSARLEATGPTLPVGYDGEVFVEGLGDVNTLWVTRPDGTQCTARIQYKAAAGDLPRLGPTPCQALPR